jgi:hypothetical protein
MIPQSRPAPASRPAGQPASRPATTCLGPGEPPPPGRQHARPCAVAALTVTLDLDMLTMLTLLLLLRGGCAMPAPRSHSSAVVAPADIHVVFSNHLECAALSVVPSPYHYPTWLPLLSSPALMLLLRRLPLGARSVGFNDRSWNDGDAPEGDARCDGLYSPDGERCLPLAANVTSE